MDLCPSEFGYAVSYLKSKGAKDPVRVFSEEADEILRETSHCSESTIPRLELLGFEKRHYLKFASHLQISSITMEPSPYLTLNFTSYKKEPNYGSFAINKEKGGERKQKKTAENLVIHVYFDDSCNEPPRHFLIHCYRSNRKKGRSPLPPHGIVTLVPHDGSPSPGTTSPDANEWFDTQDCQTDLDQETYEEWYQGQQEPYDPLAWSPSSDETPMTPSFDEIHPWAPMSPSYDEPTPLQSDFAYSDASSPIVQDLFDF